MKTLFYAPLQVQQNNTYLPNVNIYYGPYSSISEGYNTVIAGFNQKASRIPQGLTIAVGSGSTLKEYWWTGGNDSSGFTLKSNGDGTSSTVTVTTGYSVTLDNDYIILDDNTSAQDVNSQTIKIQAFNGETPINLTAGTNVTVTSSNPSILTAIYTQKSGNALIYRLNAVGSTLVDTTLTFSVQLAENVTYEKKATILVKDFSAGEIYQILTSPNTLTKDTDATLLDGTTNQIEVQLLKISNGSYELVQNLSGMVKLYSIIDTNEVEVTSGISYYGNKCYIQFNKNDVTNVRWYIIKAFLSGVLVDLETINFTYKGNTGSAGTTISTYTTTQSLYKLSATKPENPNITGALPISLPNGWTLSAPESSNTLSIWEARRTVTTVITNGVSSNSTYGEWVVLRYSSPNVISVIGALYNDNDTTPESPSGNWNDYSAVQNLKTNVWHTNLTDYTKWICIANSNGTWSTPIKIVGEDGISIDFSNIQTVDHWWELNTIQNPSVGDTVLVGTNLWVFINATDTLTYEQGVSTDELATTGSVYAGFKNLGQLKGDKGNSQYIHLKYSNNPTPSDYSTWKAAVNAWKADNTQTKPAVLDPIFTTNSGEYMGDYVGFYIDENQTDPSINIEDESFVFGDAYSWTYVKGEQGANGIDSPITENVFFNTTELITPYLIGYKIGNDIYIKYGNSYRKLISGSLDSTEVALNDLNTTDEVLPVYSTQASYASDKPVIISSDDHIGVDNVNTFEWQSQRTKKYDSVTGTYLWDDFTTPIIRSHWGYDGVDGAGVEYIYTKASSLSNAVADITAVNNVYSTTIATSGDNVLTYQDEDFVPDSTWATANSITLNCTWEDNPPTNVLQGDVIYCSTRKKTYVGNNGLPDSSSTLFRWTKFSTPTVWSYYSEDGTNGDSYSIDFNQVVLLDDNTIDLASITEASRTDLDLIINNVPVANNVTWTATWVQGSSAANMFDIVKVSGFTNRFILQIKNNVNQLTIGNYKVKYSATYSGNTYNAYQTVSIKDINLNGATYRFDVSPRSINIDELSTDSVTFQFKLQQFVKLEKLWVHNDDTVCYFTYKINDGTEVSSRELNGFVFDLTDASENSSDPLEYTLTKLQLQSIKKLTFSAYEVEGFDFIDAVDVHIFHNGNNSIIVDFDNDMDSIQYNENGLKIRQNDSVSTTVHLFDGPNEVQNISSSINILSYGGTDATLNDNTITVSNLSSTVNLGKVQVGVTYNGIQYTKTWIVNKLVNANKYELVVTPNVLNYNVDNNINTSIDTVVCSVSVQVRKTTPAGVTSLISPGNEVNVTYLVDAGQEQNASSSTIFTNTGVAFTNEYITENSPERLIVRLKDSNNVIQDVEDIHINYIYNGEAGISPVSIQLDNDSYVLDDNVVESISKNVSTTNVYAYNGTIKLLNSEITSITATLDNNLKNYFELKCGSQSGQQVVLLGNQITYNSCYIAPKQGVSIQPTSGFVTYTVVYNGVSYNKQQSVSVLDISNGASYKLIVTPNVIKSGVSSSVFIKLLEINDDPAVDDSSTVIENALSLQYPKTNGTSYYITRTPNGGDETVIGTNATTVLADNVNGLSQNYVYKAYRAEFGEGFVYNNSNYIVGKYQYSTKYHMYTTALKVYANSTHIGYIAAAFGNTELDLTGLYFDFGTKEVKDSQGNILSVQPSYIDGLAEQVKSAEQLSGDNYWSTASNPDSDNSLIIDYYGTVPNYCNFNTRLIDAETVGVAERGQDGSSATTGISLTTNFDTPIVIDDSSTDAGLAAYTVAITLQENGSVVTAYDTPAWSVEYVRTDGSSNNVFTIDSGHLKRTSTYYDNQSTPLPTGYGNIVIDVTYNSNTYTVKVPFIVIDFNNGESYNLSVTPNYAHKFGGVNYAVDDDVVITASKNNGTNTTPITNTSDNANYDRVNIGWFNNDTLVWHPVSSYTTDNNSIVINKQTMALLLLQHGNIYIGILPAGQTFAVRSDAIAVFPASNGAFLSTVFKWATSTPATPSVTSSQTYNNPVPSGWSDGIPNAPTGEYYKLYSTSRWFYLDGFTDDTWDPPTEVIDNNFYDVEFSDSETKPPVPGSGNKYDSSATGSVSNKYWFDPSTNYSNYKDFSWSNMIWKAEKFRDLAWIITKIKGEKGEDGLDGNSPSAQEVAQYITGWYYNYRGDYTQGTTYRAKGRALDYVSVSSTGNISDSNITRNGLDCLVTTEYYCVNPYYQGYAENTASIDKLVVNNPPTTSTSHSEISQSNTTQRWIKLGVANSKITVFNDAVGNYLQANILNSRALYISNGTECVGGIYGGPVNESENPIRMWYGSKEANYSSGISNSDLESATFKVYEDGSVIAKSFNGFGSFNGNYSGSSVTEITLDSWNTYVEEISGRYIIKTNLTGNLIILSYAPSLLQDLYLPKLTPQTKVNHEDVNYIPDASYIGTMTLTNLVSLTDKQITIVNKLDRLFNIHGCRYAKANDIYYVMPVDLYNNLADYIAGLRGFGLTTWKYTFADVAIGSLDNQDRFICIFPQYQGGFESGSLFTSQENITTEYNKLI